MSLQTVTAIAPFSIYQGETLQQRRIKLVQAADGVTPWPVDGCTVVVTWRTKHGARAAAAVVANWRTDNGKLALDATNDAATFATTSADTNALAPGDYELSVGIIAADGAAADLGVATVTVLAAGAQLDSALAPPVDPQADIVLKVALPITSAVGVGPFSDGKYLRAAATGLTTTGPQLGPGRSMVLSLLATTDGASHDEVVLLFGDGASRGWVLILGFSAGAERELELRYLPGSAAPIGYLRTMPGVQCKIVVTHIAATGKLRIKIDNGDRYVIDPLSAYVAANGSDDFVVGRNVVTVSGNAFDLGLVREFVFLNRELTDDEQDTAATEAGAISLASDPAATQVFNADVDYPGGTSTVVTRGTAPLTLACPGKPPRTRVVKDQYEFKSAIGAPYRDSGPRVLDAGGEWERGDEHASIAVQTDSPKVYVAVRQTISPATKFGEFKYAVNGGAATRKGLVVPQNTDPRPYPVTMGAAGTLRTLEATVGLRQQPIGTTIPVGTELDGFWIKKGAAFAFVDEPPVARRLVALVDSIGSGANATSPVTGGYLELLRGVYPGRVTVMGYGFAKLKDYANQTGGISQYADDILARCNGTQLNEVLFTLGTNDFGFTAYTDPALFAADILTLFQDLFARGPANLVVYLMTIAIRTDVSSNGGGQTLASYVSAELTVPANAAMVPFVAGGRLKTIRADQDGVVISSANLDPTDHLHWVDAGHVEAETKLRPFMGLP